MSEINKDITKNYNISVYPFTELRGYCPLSAPV